MTLALLITAVGGAWAAETYPIVYDFEAAANAGEDPANKNGNSNNGQQFYGWENENVKDYARNDYKGYSWATGSKLPEVCHVWRRSDRINGNVSGNGGLKCPNNRLMAVDGLTEGLTVTIIYDATNATNKEIVWAIGDGSSSQLTQPRATATINGVEAVSGQTTIKSGDVITVNSVTPAANGSGYIVFKVMENMVIKKIIIDEAKDPNAVDVTTDAASEQDLFTEASFEMPASDVTADYELVRDMSIQMTATMGDGTDGVRYRVKKAQQGEGYEPADMEMAAVLALVAVNDGIEQKPLTLDQDYFCRIYKLDEQTLQPEGDGVKLTDFDFAPGLYALKAVAKDDSDYAGETALSNTFQLFQGYPVEIAAQSFATYYSDDEALYLEDTDAQLYTITAVSGQTATAEPISVAPAGTPVLVKNNSADPEKTTILLIPTTDRTPDEVTVYEGFKGTLTDETIAASDAATDRYVMTGKQFVWLKDAGTIAAQRCWLEVPKTSAQSAPVISIVIDGNATGIDGIGRGESDNAQYYDLNGRKLQGKPQQKGVYVVNGKKVVVK